MTPIQLETRIQELLDGALDEEHWPELEQELLASEEARELYCHYARVSSLLRQRSKGLEGLKMHTPIIPIEEIRESQRKRAMRNAMMAAAAVVMISLVALRMVLVPEKLPALTFRVAPGAQFELTHDTSAGESIEGLMLEEGSRLQLSQGVVELNFGSGVRSVVMGPADLTLDGDNILYMKEGRAWFHVPEQAIGFQVNTGELDIVDLGTEFGVLASASNHDELHVFKGKVKVTASRLRKGSDTLVAGQARRIDPVGRLDEIRPDSGAFLTSLPTSLPYLHWSFDGRGEDLLQVQGVFPKIESLGTRVVGAGSRQGFVATSGKFGDALSSLGTGAYVESDWKGIEGDAPRTIAYWLMLPPGGEYLHPIVGWGERNGYLDSSVNSFFSLVDTTEKGTTAGVSVGGYWLNGTTPIADGQWHHIAHVYTGKCRSDGTPEIYSYVDGKLETVTSGRNEDLDDDADGNIAVDTRINDPNSVPLRVFDHLWGGESEETGAYDILPSIDELFIFEGVLSKRQIQNLYHNNHHERDDR